MLQIRYNCPAFNIHIGGFPPVVPFLELPIKVMKRGWQREQDAIEMNVHIVRTYFK